MKKKQRSTQNMNINNKQIYGKQFNCYVLGLLLIGAAGIVSSSPNHCGSLQWQCNNGQCIKIYDRCDGKAQCSDGSDEIAENCIHLFCPRYAFRCTYGACITGTDKCNGKKNCADNSDENAFLCGDNVLELERALIGNCNKSTSMQCKSGECIDIDNRCDGIKDCSDGSDETVEICSYLYCPSYAFRCGYGGCISGSSKCNGQFDCVDGSDEAAQLCEHELKQKTDKKPNVKPTPTPETEGCMIPFNREALLAQYHQSSQLLPLGTKVPSGSELFFKCEPHYVLEGLRRISCKDNCWSDPVPYCAKYCTHTTLSKGISTVVSCNYDQKPLNCSSSLRIGTKVDVSCAPGYKLPKVKPTNNRLTCDADGEWDYPKFKCVPECGLLDQDESGPQQKRRGLNNKSIIERPWHVTIFNRSSDGTLQRLCGGAVIAPNLIITAASCFVDNSSKLIDEAILYNVMMGHQLLHLQRDEYQPEQLYNISEIVLPEYTSTERNHNYEHDVAVLVLVKNIDLAKTVKPICVNHGQPIQRLPQPQETIILSVQQQLDFGFLDKGYAFSETKGRRHSLTHIVTGFSNENNEVMLINIKYYWMFIKKIIRRYKYIL